MSLEDDLYDVGDSIEKLINNAIDSQNFQKLNEQITDVVKNATSSAQYHKAMAENADPFKNSYTRQTMQSINPQMWPSSRQFQERERFDSNSVNGDSLISTFQQLGGAALAGFNGIVVLGIVLSFTMDPSDAIFDLVLGAAFAGLTYAGVRLFQKGRKLSRRIGLFRKIKNLVGSREYVEVSELCERIDMERSALVKELNTMLSAGYFKQGHLDRMGSTLMLTNNVYEQYKKLDNQKAAEQKEQERLRAQQEASGLTPKYQEMLSACEDYIAKIHQCNLDLPGEEISRKLDRLERVVQRITEEARKDPQKTGELRKFMDYYMPTTWKLLDAYRSFENEPIQSENIINTKKEIEKSLDTINAAYEKLLDDLFQTTAWDITSDISVLNSMLAQEGLTGNDFDQLRKQQSGTENAGAGQTGSGKTASSGGTVLRF